MVTLSSDASDQSRCHHRLMRSEEKIEILKLDQRNIILYNISIVKLQLSSSGHFEFKTFFVLIEYY